MEPATAEDTTRMGDYVVLKRVAIGGMAEIFLARKDGMSGFERLVVLKRILPEYAHHAEFVRMFLNEARIAATLHHTNIVQVHGIGEERGQVFFAMEFLHGEDLSRVLSRANQIGRPPALDGVLTIASAVCAGLHYAHERCAPDGTPLGIVHRDVSPHNVFVTYDGNIKLLDFGIAKATTSFGKTRTGVLKGKVAYMSPEQAYAQPVDRGSDIFCMGILLWELSTGRRLYRRRSELETLKALVDADAPRPSTIVSGYPAELEEIVMKCLRRERSERYATCEQLSEALEKFATNQGLQVSPLIATRMMRSLFKSEIMAFESAVKSGGNLVDQVIARMEATAKKSSIDDWDSNVASVIVDIGSDPDKTSLSRPGIESSTVEVDPDVENTAVEATPLDRPSTATEEMTIPADPVARPSRPLPGMPAERASAPIPRAQTPPPFAPTPTPMPVARPMVHRADPTEQKQRDWTERLTPVPPLDPYQQAPKRKLWPIAAGLAVASIAIAIIVVMSGGGGDKPVAKTVAGTEPVAEPKPETVPTEAKPEVAEPAAKSPEVTEPAAKPPEPKPAPVEPEIKKAVAPKPAPEIKKPEPKPVVAKPAPKPTVVAKPTPRPEIKKPEPKKPEPKKPEPKKPTAKDLDSLPL